MSVVPIFCESDDTSESNLDTSDANLSLSSTFNEYTSTPNTSTPHSSVSSSPQQPSISLLSSSFDSEESSFLMCPADLSALPQMAEPSSSSSSSLSCDANDTHHGACDDSPLPAAGNIHVVVKELIIFCSSLQLEQNSPHHGACDDSPLPAAGNIHVVVKELIIYCSSLQLEQNSPQHGAPVVNSGEDNEWHGFRLTGDNIDKNVKPRDMRINNQTKSLHYFHVFAVKDRINFSHLSSNAEMVCFDNIDFGVFCPNLDDEAKLVLNFETLVTRMLVEHIPGIQHLFPHVTHHIQHKYSRNMSQKSTVVSTSGLHDILFM